MDEMQHAQDALARARAHFDPRSTRASFSDGERALIARCLAWLDEKARPGLLGAAIGFVAQSSPVRAAFRMVPDALVAPAHRTLTRALVTLSSLAARTAGAERIQARIDEERARATGGSTDAPPPAPASADVAELEALARRLIRSDLFLGTAAGTAGGLGGVLALPVEVPVVVALGLRAAHRTLAALGIDSSTAPADAIPLLALDLAIGGDAPQAVARSLGWLQERWTATPTSGDAGGDAGGDAAEMVAGVTALAVGAAGGAMLAAVPPGLVGEASTAALGLDAVSFFHVQIAVERIAVRLAARRLAGVLPLVGAAIGGALAYTFVDAVIDAARTLGSLYLLGRRV